MAKPSCIELATGERIPILHEDRSVIAIDKPRGWMLVPFSWQDTGRNLQAALTSSIQGRDFWARSRNLRYLRFVHRLDADTTGVLLLAKSPGALRALAELFESRKMDKLYLAVTEGIPREAQWTCRLKLAPIPKKPGRMHVNERTGKPAETVFRVLQTGPHRALVEARPLTGRTHQIRVHLAESGCPVLGDELYGSKLPAKNASLALRAVGLRYNDPFTRRPVEIRAPVEEFVRQFGFEIPNLDRSSSGPGTGLAEKWRPR